MSRRSFFSLSNKALVEHIHTLLTRERLNLAELLDCLAEADGRQLFLAAGYSCMHGYCVGEFHMSEDEAWKRVQAARAARKCPAIVEAVADGRLHLTAVVRLAPHLTPGNALELIAAATHRTKAKIELMLAERFPRPDVETRLQPIPTPVVPTFEPAMPVLVTAGPVTSRLVPEPVAPSIPQRLTPSMAPLPTHARVAPLSPGRFVLQTMMTERGKELLDRVKCLLGHTVPEGDIATVLEHALELAAEQLEKKKFAKTERPREAIGTTNGRHIPAHIRREVEQRDGGRCTFVGANGRRCNERMRVELDHVKPVAKGGETTADNLRLLCRAHNQFEADRAFGASFMQRRRPIRAS